MTALLRLSTLLIASLLAFALIAPTAWSQDIDQETRDRARVLYDEATAAYDRGEYQAALEDWQEAYELTGASIILYSIGNAHERLGNLEEAVDALNGYLEGVSSDEERRLLDLRIDNLEERARLQREQQEFERAERERERREAEEREARLRAEQERLEEELRAERLAELRRDPAGLRVTRWTFISIAGAAAINGLVFQLRANSLGNGLEDDCSDVGDGSLLCDAGTSDDWDAYDTSRQVANISYGVAGGAALVGGILLFIHPNRDRTLDDFQVTPTVHRGGGGFSVRSRF